MKRKAGRPSRLTQKIIDELVAGTEQGLNRKTACALAGISRATFCRWMAKGRESQRGLYRDLCDRIEGAEEVAKSITLQSIREIAQGGKIIKKVVERRNEKGELLGYTETYEELPPSLQAATWLLERRWPEEFGPKALLEVANDGNPFKVSLFQQVMPGSDTTQVIQQGADQIEDTAEDWIQ